MRHVYYFSSHTDVLLFSPVYSVVNNIPMDWSSDQYVIDAGAAYPEFRDINTAANLNVGPMIPHRAGSYETKYQLEQQSIPAYYRCECGRCIPPAIRSNATPLRTKTIDERYTDLYNAEAAHMRRCREASAAASRRESNHYGDDVNHYETRGGNSAAATASQYDATIVPNNIICMLTFLFIIVVIIACLCMRSVVDLQARIGAFERASSAT
jgi:hypothetical protein